MHKFTLFALLLFSSKLYALQTYSLKDQQQTTVKMSSTEANRISVADDRIHQVFGVPESYTVETDEQGGQIFLKALLPEKESPFTLTLITEKGVTHDLRIKPCKTESQSILLKPAHIQKNIVLQAETRQEMLDFIHDFKGLAEKDDVYIDSHPHENSRENNDFKATLDLTYEDDTYTGLRFIIKNKRSYPVSLEPSEFASSEDRVVAFQNPTLAAFGTTKAYVVRRKS